MMRVMALAEGTMLGSDAFFFVVAPAKSKSNFSPALRINAECEEEDGNRSKPLNLLRELVGKPCHRFFGLTEIQPFRFRRRSRATVPQPRSNCLPSGKICWEVTLCSVKLTQVFALVASDFLAL